MAGIFACALTAALCALAFGWTVAARAANVIDAGTGVPFALNESDHILIAQLTEKEGEEDIEGPWSIWAEGKSTALKPLNGAEKHEEDEKPKHELFLYNINSAGDVGGWSTETVTDNGEEKGLPRPVWFGPKGEPHEVPLLQDTFTNKKGETFHDIGLGVGIDDHGNVAATDGYQPEAGANVAARATIAPGGGSPVFVGAADVGPGEQSEAFFINDSGQTLGAVLPSEESSGKTRFYLWPTPASAGTELNFDSPYSLANDGSVVGERGGSFFLRTPDGKETAIKGIEKPYRVNSSHIAVGLEMVEGKEHAAAWQAGGVTDLNSLLPKGSGWVLNRAVAINDAGDIAGIGHHEGQLRAFLLEAGAPTATQLNCAATAEKEVARCTAQVSDKSGELTLKAPTGSVAFTVTAASGSPGSLKEPSCALKATATPGVAECSVLYKQPAPGTGGQVTVTAAYGGDSDFAPSSAELSRCGAGKIELSSISWTSRHDHGFQLNSEAILHGCGFSTSTVITWGNAYAKEAVPAENVNDDGTQIKITVPYEATSGDVTVTEGGDSATLHEQPIDTWRDTDGFNFENYAHVSTVKELSEAFADPILDEEGDALPAYYNWERQHSKPHGVCFGFAFLSSAIADGTSNPDDFGTAPTAFGLSKASVEHAIAVDWLKVYSTSRVPYLYGRLTSAAEMKAAALLSFGPNPYYHPVIVDFKWKTHGAKPKAVQSHAHAIAVFAIEDDTPAQGQYTMLAANSNEPFVDEENANANGVRHATAQANSAIIVNEATNTWSMPGENASGSMKDIEVIPIARMEGPQHLVSAPGSSTTTTSLSPTTGIESLNDPATGKPVNLEGDAPEDVSLSPELDGGPPSPATYTGPGLAGISTIQGPGTDWHETLASTSGGVEAQWTGPGGGASLTAGAGHDATEFNSHAATIGLAPAPGQTPSASGTVQVYSAGSPERVLTISGPVVKGKIKAALGGGGAQVSALGGGRFHISLSIAGGHLSGQTFDLGSITLAKGQKLSLRPASWNSLASTRLTAKLSGGHGRARTLKLRNRAKPPRTRVLARSLTNGASSATVHLKLALPSLRHGSVSVEAIARQKGRKLSTAKTPVKIGGSRQVAVDVTLAHKLGKGSKVEILIRTGSGGATPSSSTTRTAIAVRR